MTIFRIIVAGTNRLKSEVALLENVVNGASLMFCCRHIFERLTCYRGETCTLMIFLSSSSFDSSDCKSLFEICFVLVITVFSISRGLGVSLIGPEGIPS